ncbi:MAG: tetratricopeptide repeat protein, partial [Victivallaceae bacterium]|nr:tetratricopeptide repeat protein [Victivallaceae bacterium]
EWDAKDAEKYYAQALEYFRKAREKRDAVSLYAAINDDLKKQSIPTQKPTTLNQWKRTIYHDEDPLKLYNAANAPSWYISDKEKNCVFVLGLVAFSNQKYDIAKEHWERIKEYSPETAVIDPRLPVTVHKRLIKSCRLKAMAFWPEEKDGIRNKNILLKIQYAEYLILLAKYPEAIEFFNKILKDSKNDVVKAVAMFGIAMTNSLWFEDKTHQTALSIYKNIIENKKLRKHAIYGRTVMEYAKLHMAISGGHKKAMPIFKVYLGLFPKGRYRREAEYKIACCCIMMGEIDKAKAIYEKLKNGEDAYEFFLKAEIDEYIKNKQENSK